MTQAETLMKVLGHPGRGNSKCCIVGNWHCFSFLTISPLFHEASETSRTTPAAYDTAFKTQVEMFTDEVMF